MVETGIYHPFSWVARKSRIDLQTIWRTDKIDIVITGDFTAVTLKKLSDDTTLATATAYIYSIGDEDIKSFRLTHTLASGDKAYVSIDDKYFSDCIIEQITASLKYDCLFYLHSLNSCANQYHDWDGDPVRLDIGLREPSEVSPVFEEETRILITEKGKKTKFVRVSKRHRLEFLAPAMMVNLLNGMKLNDTNHIQTNYTDPAQIINLEIESQEQSDGRYSKFILTFEYAETLTDGNTCCEDIDLDDILSPETPAAECTGFTAEVVNTSGTLSVTLTNAPGGTVTYKWYRNNVYLTNTATITVSGSGNYRVDVTDTSCKVSASYFIEDSCALFSIDVTSSGNEIDATASNVPDGETVTWEVSTGGAVVSASLPYTAESTGVYFVTGTAGDCSKIKAVYIIIQETDCDFTISIDEDGNELTAVTDAASPTYLWELETSTGKTEIGTTETITMSGKGIYWLTITNGVCEKETYLYKEPETDMIVYTNAKVSGTEITVLQIDLANVTNPGAELEVYLNGVLQTYTSPTPLAAGQYGISSGKMTFSSALSNATLTIIKK